jgi:hypothetical protein
MTLYRNPHVTQFDGTAKASQNCTPTTGAAGADASSGGLVHLTGGQLRAHVKQSEETNPNTPGWSLLDLDLGLSRIGVPFVIRSGTGWGGVISALDAGLYVALQGDSDQFGNATCSGVFDGDHCIGVHPARSGTRRWINDPICKAGRWEEEATLKRYAQKLYSGILFGVFLSPVPEQWPFAIGPRPSGATMWVETLRLARIWRQTGTLRKVLRPIEADDPGEFTFDAWAGANTTRTWAPGPKSTVRDKAVFRPILSGVHKGKFVRVTDQGSTWHHLFRSIE